MFKRLFFFLVLSVSLSATACNDSATSNPQPPSQPAVSSECKTACISETILGECENGDVVERDCSLEGKICANSDCIIDTEKDEECTENRCDGDIFYECVNHKPSMHDCSLNNMICSVNGCVTADVPPKCTRDECKSATVLVSCDDGQPREIDCTVNGQICEGDQCITPAQCTAAACDSETVLNKCEGGQIVPYDCADDGMICEVDACVQPPAPMCTKDVCDGNGLLLYKCNDGDIEIVNCADQNKICSNGACDDYSCVADLQDCNGNLLYACQDGNFSITDCAKTDQICDKLLRECVYECETDTYYRSCAAQNVTRQCVNHHITEVACGETEKCVEGHCIEDECLKCTESQYCLDGECLDEQPQQLLGMPCECWGEDCFIRVSGYEFNQIFRGLALVVVASLIKDDDMILAPNFFSSSNRGCEALEAVVPDGMSVGCFREGMLEFPSSIMTLMSKIPGVLQAANIKSELVTIFLPIAVEVLQGGLHFTSPNGYCMTATIDVEGTIKHEQLKKLVNKDAFEKSKDPENPKLVDHFNTGNHDTVLAASAEAGDSYCPDNGVLFSYTIERTMESIGDFDLGFDICLKPCETEADCRTGYQCVDIPTKASLHGTSETKKACFDKRNVDFISDVLSRVRETLDKEPEETNGDGEP